MITKKDRKTCPLCGVKNFAAISHHASFDGEFMDCLSCGKFKIASSAKSTISSFEKRHLLSGVTRRLWELHGKIIEIYTYNLESLIESARVPSNPIDSMDYILHYLAAVSDVGQRIDLQPKDYPIVFAKSSEQFNFLLKTMNSLSYLSLENSTNNKGYRIEVKGWERLLEIGKQRNGSGSVFVAMWFDESMDEVWEHGFKVAIEDIGLNPVRMDLVEHNGKICDRILAEIRQSSLLIADFTGNNGGVYFEAGFALGLGTHCIFTCSSKFFEEEGVHFDTRQYNHLVWENIEDLKQKLINRVKATLPNLVSSNRTKE